MTKFRVFFTSLFLYSALYASGPFTLTGLECVNISVKNKTKLFEEEDITNITEILQKAVIKTHLKTNQRDCASFRITIEAIDAKPNYYLHTKLWVGEDIVANRDKKTETFALTYYASDFVKSQDIHDDIIQSVQSLTDNFVTHYKNDNEE